MKPAKAFFEEIRGLIHSARATVARGVDLVQVHTNFEIGRRIVEQEMVGVDRAEYGKELMKNLAAKLSAEFGKGFSHTNLKLMRLFYLQQESRIGQSLTDQFGSPAKAQSVIGKLESQAKGQTSAGFLEILRLAPEGSSIGQTASDQFAPSRPFTLSWTHYVFLLGKEELPPKVIELSKEVEG